MTSSETAEQLAASVGQTLPTAYISFLDGVPARPTLGKGYSPILDFQGRHWRPYSREKLASQVQYNRRASRPRALETAAIAEELLSGGEARRAEMTMALNERGFAIERLARGFCIGDDGNGDPLFVDPDTGAVYCYYRDGMDVMAWADSLVELVTSSRDWTGDEDAGAENGSQVNLG